MLDCIIDRLPYILAEETATVLRMCGCYFMVYFVNIFCGVDGMEGCDGVRGVSLVRKIGTCEIF